MGVRRRKFGRRYSKQKKNYRLLFLFHRTAKRQINREINSRECSLDTWEKASVSLIIIFIPREMRSTRADVFTDHYHTWQFQLHRHRQYLCMLADCYTIIRRNGLNCLSTGEHDSSERSTKGAISIEPTNIYTLDTICQRFTEIQESWGIDSREIPTSRYLFLSFANNTIHI